MINFILCASYSTAAIQLFLSDIKKKSFKKQEYMKKIKLWDHSWWFWLR